MSVNLNKSIWTGQFEQVNFVRLILIDGTGETYQV